MKTTLVAASILSLVSASGALAQEIEKQKVEGRLFKGWEAQAAVAPISPSIGVLNAPFTAEAVTEFTQELGDGNRIERRASSSIARDSRGRTRREQEVVMLGALAPLLPEAPRLVVINDPTSGTEYTLDEKNRTARQSGALQLKAKVIEGAKGEKMAWIAAPAKKAFVAVNDVKKSWVVEGPAKVTSEPLGTRQIEGVAAEGTRTTMTIREGEVGNLRPIEVVTERWYSRDLQMEILISRRDPRSGDTAYRLTNIVRAEPPPDLFVVPPGYTVVNEGMKKIFADDLKIELFEAARQRLK